MSRLLSIVFFIFLSLSSTSPSSGTAISALLAARPSQKLAAINREYLCQKWVHSSEEQKPADKAELYRPSGFKRFPPGRGRMQYTFYKNGACEWYFFSPDDAHYFKPGKWEIDPHDERILRINKGDKTESYRVLELTKDILRIALIEPSRRNSRLNGPDGPRGSQAAKVSSQGDGMTTKASGTFEVKMTPQAPEEAGGSAVGRMLLDKKFHGDLAAASNGQMLAFSSSVAGSAGYVAVEQVTGVLNGHNGTFVLLHRGLMTRGAPDLSITVVPDSGTDQLTGLTGKMEIEIASDGKHSYTFEYTIDQAS